MYNILCVTNRKLCADDFLDRIERIASCNPAGIILREKDMSESEYGELAGQVLEICRNHNTLCILHNFVDVALELKANAIHLPLHVLGNVDEGKLADFGWIGASCHSVSDALEAQRLGCTYITAGHVFETDCKKGLPGRGLPFLQEIVRSVDLPVYGIGGIDERNIRLVRNAGAAGACVMSGVMCCDDVENYLKNLIFE